MMKTDYDLSKQDAMFTVGRDSSFGFQMVRGYRNYELTPKLYDGLDTRLTKDRGDIMEHMITAAFW